MNLKNNIQAASIFLLIFIIAFTFAINSRNNNRLDDELLTLTQDLIEYRQTLEALQVAQRIIIIDLKKNLTDHQEQITINFDEVNRLNGKLHDMRIETDYFSETSLIYLFDEVWDKLDRLEKKVK